MAAATGRTAAQRREENARYNRRRVAAGLAKLNVLVPLVRLGELDALLVQRRKEARAQLASDQPSADRDPADPRPLPDLAHQVAVAALARRLTAEAWLRECQPRLAGRPEKPCARTVT